MKEGFRERRPSSTPRPRVNEDYERRLWQLMAHKLFCVAQVCERDPALSIGHRAMPRQTAVTVEVIEAEVAL